MVLDDHWHARKCLAWAREVGVNSEPVTFRLIRFYSQTSSVGRWGPDDFVVSPRGLVEPFDRD